MSPETPLEVMNWFAAVARMMDKDEAKQIRAAIEDENEALRKKCLRLFAPKCFTYFVFTFHER